MDMKLKGNRAAVIGASKGIGRATAEGLAAEGCNLMLAARNRGELQTLAAGLKQRHGVSVEICVADLSLKSDQQKFFEEAGIVDILVNCAGSNPAGRISEISDELWRKSWDLKVFGYINLTRLFYSNMKIRGRGVIVNVIGNSAERMDDRYILGSTGNSALVSLTKALGAASPDDGIRVVGVNPGLTQTDRIDFLLKTWSTQKYGSPDYGDKVLTEMKLPFGRAATAEEIADAVVFLASPRAAYITGTVLTVDGGAAHRNLH